MQAAGGGETQHLSAREAVMAAAGTACVAASDEAAGEAWATAVLREAGGRRSAWDGQAQKRSGSLTERFRE